MYKSPIDLMIQDLRIQQEDEIFRAVQNVGVVVDKEELIRALAYDRGQYQKGYMDGLKNAVRHGEWSHLGGDEWCCTVCGEVIHTEGSWEKPTKKYCNECGAKMDGGKL